MQSTIERMKSRPRERRRVTDVVQIGRSDKHLALV
jgi:hypothetical protein